jgi:riboflavin kinase / FMN adenylyltransferase
MKTWLNSESMASDFAHGPLKDRAGRGLALTIGNFDGVHLGHQELIGRIVKKAREIESLAVLLTFDPHPVQILAPEKKHTRLFSLRDQQERLEALGVDGILRQPFSREFSGRSPLDFLENFILKFFHPSLIVVGEDFSFGANRQGNSELLSLFCAEKKIELQLVKAKEIRDQIISTSRIRKLLAAGDLNLVTEMLGRPYSLRGVVEKGEARGRKLGFPTANIKPEADFFPKLGVYVCHAYVEAGIDSAKYLAVMNLGMNRTFVEGDHHPIKAEVHLLDTNLDLYGRILKVELLQYLREEKKFSSLDELKTQIARDIESARGSLKK